MSIGIVSAAYISAAILFILSLGGLSNQESAKRAVWYGIAGMALAVFATVFGPGSGKLWLVLVMFAIAAAIGWQVAMKVQMTEMPQLVAALHSFVGLAAVFIGYNAHLELGAVQALDPAAREALTGFAAVLAHKTGVEISILKVEVFLGVFIGAVTFTGSVIAFGKLAGKVDGKAKKLPGGHLLNAGAALLSVILLVMYFNGAGAWTLHPSQIAIAKRVFSPDPAEVAFARRILEAMPDGSGAVMIDGKMQDDATWKQAKVIVDLARQVAARDPDLAEHYGM